MGLSEREQKLLEELERSLTDNAFVDGAKKLSKTRVSARRLITGSVIAVAGVAVLVAGVSMRQMLFGIAGFAVMLVGVSMAASTNTSK